MVQRHKLDLPPDTIDPRPKRFGESVFSSKLHRGRQAPMMGSINYKRKPR